jgi:hypothetical protein
VATDQKTSIVAAEFDSTGSPIENELPAYRAISKAAVLSVLCGALSICSFAHPFFYLFGLVAVVLGFWANLSIKRYPDMITGSRLANAGVALGIVFSLTAVTVSSVQTYIRTRSAARFARAYAKTLEEPSQAKALWYNLPPLQRQKKSPTEMMQEFDAAKGKERMAIDQRTMGLTKLRRQLASSPNTDVHFVRIENVGEDDTHGAELNIFATALFEVHGAASTAVSEKERFALGVLKARPKGRQYEWWVEDLIFPYTPRSYVAPEKPADDGHGHAH